MGTVWKVAPGDNAYMWDETHGQRCITINWENTKDLSRLTREALKKLVGPRSVNQVWSFVHEVQPGDTIVANKGESQVVGIGLVETPYLAPNNEENPRRTAKGHRHAHLVNWEIVTPTPIDLPKKFFGHMPPTIKKLYSKECRDIKQACLARDRSLKDKLDRLLPDDDPQHSDSQAEGTMKALLQQLGQVIVYGPPGTGKTRAAKRVALGLLTGKDLAPEATPSEDEIEKELERVRETGRFDLVVFHPAYEYEQFVGGIGPAVQGSNLQFQAKAGPFLRICRAAEGKEPPAVLIIDEINRGNLPKLLGELVYALEYRDHKVSLPFAYNDRDYLRVPKNLYIIATMNSADRSIGHIDVAIRRRFGLYHLGPQSGVVRNVWTTVGDEAYGAQLAALMDRLNDKLRSQQDAIAAVELGVGHSYFLPTQRSWAKASEQQVEAARQEVKMKWMYQVQPLLREYAQLLPGSDSLRVFFNRSLDECLAQP